MNDLPVEMPLFDSIIEKIELTSPKQFEIIRIGSKRAAELNELWHTSMPIIKTYSVCKPCYCATFNNRIYAVALWSYPIAANRIKGGEYCLELRRFAISSEAPFNTASFMLSKMAKLIKDHPKYQHIERLISYQDTGSHHGTIYKAANWQNVNQSEYISWNNHSKRPGSLEQSKAPKIRWEYRIR